MVTFPSTFGLAFGPYNIDGGREDNVLRNTLESISNSVKAPEADTVVNAKNASQKHMKENGTRRPIEEMYALHSLHAGYICKFQNLQTAFIR